jgi:Ca2+:H+ antiporter
VCFVVALLVSGAEVLGGGRGGYGKTLRGLAWYIGWPFGKYVEGEGAPDGEEGDEPNYGTTGDGSPIRGVLHRQASEGSSSIVTVRCHRQTSEMEAEVEETITMPQTSGTTIRPEPASDRPEPTVSFASSITVKGKAKDSAAYADERAPLLIRRSHSPSPGYFRRPRNRRAKILGRLVYWPLFALVVAPMMLFVCILCWGGVITIPMAKLTWALLELLAFRPLEINFRSAPKVQVPNTPSPHSSPGTPSGAESGDTTLAGSGSPSGFTIKRAHLTAGQLAPTSGPRSTVLLCTYRAVGLQFYKYTIGGVNIIFINLLPLVFFTIFDAFVLLPAAEHAKTPLTPLFAALTSQALIFVLALASVIPLSYFIGMAVASISAQSSIGMGAVINATFGSVIEVILYGIALTQGKGRLVEGSIVGSILAGVLLMPGASMCSGALKRKEQRFNAKSAGVTSTMLIMAIIGTLTPTMFYQTYGSVRR